MVMIELPIKFISLPLAITVLLLLIAGAFNTILSKVIIGGIEVIKLPDPNNEGTLPLGNLCGCGQCGWA